MESHFGHRVDGVIWTGVVEGLEDAKVGSAGAAAAVVDAALRDHGLVGVVASAGGAKYRGAGGKIRIGQRHDFAALARVLVDVKGVFDGFGDVAVKAMIVMSLEDEEVLHANIGGAVGVAAILLKNRKSRLHLILVLAVDTELVLKRRAGTRLVMFVMVVVVVMILVALDDASQSKEGQDNDGRARNHCHCSCFDMLLVPLVQVEFFALLEM